MPRYAAARTIARGRWPRARQIAPATRSSPSSRGGCRALPERRRRSRRPREDAHRNDLEVGIGVAPACGEEQATGKIPGHDAGGGSRSARGRRRCRRSRARPGARAGVARRRAGAAPAAPPPKRRPRRGPAYRPAARARRRGGRPRSPSRCRRGKAPVAMGVLAGDLGLADAPMPTSATRQGSALP